jgi:pimeloyl-ACP methyl ester carboxylesterase
MSQVVLLHGAWHGSWCWSLVTEQLAGLGVSSVAVDMEGLGLGAASPVERWSRPFDSAAFAQAPSTVAGVTATSAARVLIEQVRRIGRGEPVVLVAHSMGGVIATVAAELEPALFRNVVYVAAFAPVGGMPCGAYIELPENAGSLVPALLVGNPAGSGALRIDAGDVIRHPDLRAAFYGDVDEVVTSAAIGLLSPDVSLGIAAETVVATPGRFGSVAHTYVHCAEDFAVRPALQRRFVDDLDAISKSPTHVVELDSSHSPFFSHPAELAETIASSVSSVSSV